MTPEQTHQMVILCNMILVEEPLLAIGARVRAMLAAERAAVVEECAKVAEDELCARCWTDDAQLAAETIAAAIRKLGEKR